MMDSRIEQFLKDEGFTGKLGSENRNRKLVQAKQLICYLLSQLLDFQEVAKMMGCSTMTAYRGAKVWEKHKDSPLAQRSIDRIKDQLAKNYDMSFLETGDIPLNMLKL